jgi:hypothetical protein
LGLLSCVLGVVLCLVELFQLLAYGEDITNVGWHYLDVVEFRIGFVLRMASSWAIHPPLADYWNLLSLADRLVSLSFFKCIAIALLTLKLDYSRSRCSSGAYRVGVVHDPRNHLRGSKDHPQHSEIRSFCVDRSSSLHYSPHRLPRFSTRCVLPYAIPGV